MCRCPSTVGFPSVIPSRWVFPSKFSPLLDKFLLQTLNIGLELGRSGEPKCLYEEKLSRLPGLPYLSGWDIRPPELSRPLRKLGDIHINGCLNLRKTQKKKRKLDQGNSGGGLFRVSKTISLEPKLCSWTFHRTKQAHEHARQNVKLGGRGADWSRWIHSPKMSISIALWTRSLSKAITVRLRKKTCAGILIFSVDTLRDYSTKPNVLYIFKYITKKSFQFQEQRWRSLLIIEYKTTRKLISFVDF